MSQKKYLSLERLAEYDALLKAKIAQDDASTLDAAKEYADGLIEGVNTSITNITNGDIVVKEAEHATSADSAVTADSATSAESATKATQDGNGAVIADTYETKADASAKLDEAKEYTDTLKTYVGTIPEGATATDVVGYIQEKTSGIASEGAMTELSNRVGIVEGKVSTIEGDYLTSADKTELQTNIDTVSSAVELLTNGVDAETVDGVNDLIAYVNEHGTEVTGMKADIKANADALAELAPVAKTGSWNDLVDRPFGEEQGILFTVAEHQELTLNRTFVTDKLCAYINTTDNNYHSKGIPSGQYLVIFDGESYIVDNLEVKAINNLPANLIGNPYLGNGELKNDVDYEDNGLPFLILWVAGGRPCALYAADSTVAHTIEVHAIGNQTKCIDEKYIPDTIARTADQDALASRVTTAESNIDTLEGNFNSVSTAFGEYKDAHASDYTNAQIDAAIKVVADNVAALNDTYVSDEELAQAIEDEVTRANGAYAAKALETTVSEHKADTIAHITAAERSLWNASEKNAKDYADGLNTAMTTKVDGAIDRVSANETAIGNLNTAVAGKVAQGDFNSAVERVAALEAWHENFEECSEADIRLLFEQ